MTATETTTASHPATWVEANQRYLTAALDVVRARLLREDVEAAEQRRDSLRQELTEPPALEKIVAALGLSDFERDVLLLCAGVELDTALARACATAHGDDSCPYATFSLAMATLPQAHWSAVIPVAPLRRWHLVELARPDAPTTSPLRADERVVHALAGIAYLDPRLDVLARAVPAPPPLPASLRDAAVRLVSAWSSPGGRQARLHGRRRGDLQAVVAAASATLGLQPVLLRAGDLPGGAAEREAIARLCERETALSGVSWLVDVDDGAPDAARLGLDLAARLGAPVAVTSRAPLETDPGELAVIEVGPGGAGECRSVWRDELGWAPASLNGWADRLAGQFDLGVSGVREAVDEVRRDLSRDGPAGDAAGPRLWEACRRQARPALDDLTQRIEARATWDDLVLPSPQRALLRQIAVHVRHRLTVFDDWGFSARSSRGSGVAALFAGPSGTGKTFAAEVLATELALDLHRVDLSQVVSKYIGETEKNLRRIFDAAEAGGAVLLFDEADALFGKRSEVKDSHDRYANIEVSYLLQRMETYRGLAVLTTNLKDALDPAFLRRLRFVVQFPFPDAVGRAEIWRRIFPPELPTEGLVPERLAQLTVSGATIRNIAMSAAFLAADAGEPVRMPHALAAARTEYAKLERPLTDAEAAGWTT